MGFLVSLAPPKILLLDKMKENAFSFAFVLAYSYLCGLKFEDYSRKVISETCQLINSWNPDLRMCGFNRTCHMLY